MSETINRGVGHKIDQKITLGDVVGSASKFASGGGALIRADSDDVGYERYVYPYTGIDPQISIQRYNIDPIAAHTHLNNIVAAGTSDE